ncbi:glutathione S-transferase [Enterobacterales bacterium CwR94]|nr:glutathione S-transferase [Enterobacterales bacterium CwR94]
MSQLTLYGARGWGSAITEVMLTLAGEEYDFVDVVGFDKPGSARETLQALNPQAQVPTLVLPDGSVMSESAAIALWLLDRHPHLAPRTFTPERARFQRLMIWLVATVYPTFTYADYPERWVPGDGATFVENILQSRREMWLWLEQETETAWLAGEEMTLVDCWLVVMVTWRPGRNWFEVNTPTLATIAANVRTRPELRNILELNGLASS